MKILLNTRWHIDLKKEKDFLTYNISKTCNFYRLAKVHNFEEIKIVAEAQKSNTKKFQVPVTSVLEPIVADPSSPTNSLHKLIGIRPQLFIYKILKRNKLH